MSESKATLKVIEVFRDWEPILLDDFVEHLIGLEEVQVRVPLPSHGRTRSYLDICDELLEASYFCEKLSAQFECGQLDRRCEDHKDFFLLQVRVSDHEELASVLHRLQWVFNTPQDEELIEAAGEIRDAVLEHERTVSDQALRYPEIVDGYLTNRINGAYFDFPEDVLAEEFERYPERRFGFFRSPYFRGVEAAVYLSKDAWLIPSALTLQEAFKRHMYPEAEFSLLNAEFISINDAAMFLSEQMVLTLSLRRVAEGMGCLKFAESDLMESLRLGNARYGVSEFKDFAFIESAGMTAVFFNLTEARGDVVEQALTPLFEKYKSATYMEPSVQIDWSQFDDERFEQLCYDLVYHDPRFDKSTIRKMGKSRSRDGGRDIVVMSRPEVGGRAPRKYILQCKAIAPDKSLSTSNLGSMSDVIDQYGATGYAVITSGVIDATVYDRIDGIARTRDLDTVTWSRLEIERFLARRPVLLSRYAN